MELAHKIQDAMLGAGLDIKGDIDWHEHNKAQRFALSNHRTNKKHVFVFVHPGGASFGDWRNPATWQTIWEKSGREVTPIERKARQDRLDLIKREREALLNYARKRAFKLLYLAGIKNVSETHPYVIYKKIIPYYAWQIRSYIVLPIRDMDGQLISLQYIKPNGFKQFKKHASPKEGMLIMAEAILPTDTIRICEGWATGCTIYEAFGPPVIVAFSATNLPLVASKIAQKYTQNAIHICADNDAHLKKNVGYEEGIKAAKVAGGKLILPNFVQLPQENVQTDWNDLFCLAGMDEVEQQLSLSSKYV